MNVNTQQQQTLLKSIRKETIWLQFQLTLAFIKIALKADFLYIFYINTRVGCINILIIELAMQARGSLQLCSSAIKNSTIQIDFPS